MIGIIVDTREIDGLIRRGKENFTVFKQEQISKKWAKKGFKLVKQNTPKRSGKTRNRWRVYKTGKNQWVIENDSPVMRFLEHGTKAHGPVTAKFLFVPIKRKITQWRPGLVMGKDYILTKKVRGIKPHHIIRDVAEKIEVGVVNDMDNLMKKVLR